jgi:hypothetical protein
MIVTKASPASPLTLASDTFGFFEAKNNAKQPCLLEVPGSSNLDMQLLNVTATGTVKGGQPGTLKLGLYAHAVAATADLPPDNTSAKWVLIGETPEEPISGADDHIETMWMVQGNNLMFSFVNGKMQGCFQSNVADNPEPLEDINTNLNNIKGDVNPVMYFAVGATFAPTSDDGTSKAQLTLSNFLLTGEL